MGPSCSLLRPIRFDDRSALTLTPVAGMVVVGGVVDDVVAMLVKESWKNLFLVGELPASSARGTSKMRGIGVRDEGNPKIGAVVYEPKLWDALSGTIPPVATMNVQSPTSHKSILKQVYIIIQEYFSRKCRVRTLLLRIRLNYSIGLSLTRKEFAARKVPPLYICSERFSSLNR